MPTTFNINENKEIAKQFLQFAAIQSVNKSLM